MNEVVFRQRPSLNSIAQCLARHVFHDKEVAIPGGLEIVNRGDVGVIQLGQRQRFLAEASACPLIREQVGRQHLEGDLPMEAFVLGEVDLAIAAGTDERNDPVVAEGAADQRRNRRRRATRRGLQRSPC